MSDLLDGEVKEQLVKRLDKLTPESKPKWGRMSVEQMLAHMNDAFKIALGMKPAIDNSNFYTRNIMFPAALRMPSWPKSSATAVEMDPDKDASPARDFYTELEFLKKMIDVFNEREPGKLKPHPMFGPLNKKHWRNLFVKHLNHHLEQFGV